ncbi:MAG: enoyl-CoA hydratase [Stappia sp.]|uniref:MaoC family dehydratase n=1 Tax=Stappia sp. TaxID=1870903 RepID=UPI000C5E3C77|nr:MaoC family dehydratase [Stappia sp.]MAB00616.1 enoyl-CoA hydratase [Stappia sp.]MBM18686.1 enoyl-CoA hydratase [Stappia sp.]|tara:strand:- start:7 stop:465 length:459 start_codon:yes stop_codon:yes gene_type:complete
MSTFRHFEDFTVGETIDLGSTTVTREEVLSFAREFDPQPFHLDDEAGRASVLGGLAASGWHTCSMLMRLLCDNLLLASSCNGSPGVEEVRWMRPVFPGDRLSATAEVQAARPLRSRPGLGMVTLVATVRNQDGLPVMTSRNAILFAKKDIAA